MYVFRLHIYYLVKYHIMHEYWSLWHRFGVQKAPKTLWVFQQVLQDLAKIPSLQGRKNCLWGSCWGTFHLTKIRQAIGPSSKVKFTVYSVFVSRQTAQVQQERRINERSLSTIPISLKPSHSSLTWIPEISYKNIDEHYITLYYTLLHWEKFVVWYCMLYWGILDTLV